MIEDVTQDASAEEKVTEDLVLNVPSMAIQRAMVDKIERLIADGLSQEEATQSVLESKSVVQ